MKNKLLLTTKIIAYIMVYYVGIRFMLIDMHFGSSPIDRAIVETENDNRD